jgi:hypothetical protein
MRDPLEPVYENLYKYCESRGFAGHDPFDGLNSPFVVFRTQRLARLLWLQMVKRAPIDLRRTLHVAEGVNPKGLALFALAELSRLRATGDTEHAENAGELLGQLLQTKIAGKTPGGDETASFGYNFDWQSRGFFAPVGTPAVVPTAFACRALVEAYQAFREPAFLEMSEQICRFIVSGLARPVESDAELCFSYTPVDTGIVYNASLLAGETLASVGQLIGNEEYLGMAAKAARFVINRQRSDGAWVYGEAQTQQWVDNFHTGYILVSLKRISDAAAHMQDEISPAISRGIEYWLANFFLEDGTPKYYDSSVYPVDIHSAAVAIAAMSELSPLDARLLPVARLTADWTISNMLDADGHFYYQLRKRGPVKTSFMRWGQAWMAYALAKLMEAEASAA